MKAPITVALGLWLAALTPAYAIPAKFGSKEDPAFRIIPLQQPDAVTTSQIHRSFAAIPRLRPSPAQEIESSGKPSSRILHGSLASDCQFPHQVALRTNSGLFCGGSLINRSWILTAAHCIPNGVLSIQVFAGSVEWREAPKQVFAQRIILHGGFNEWLHNDIALLDLGESIDDNDCIDSVDLETEGCGTDVLVGELAEVSGWGLINDQSNGVESLLRYVETEIISNDRCYQTYGPTVLQSGICSVSPRGANGTLCSGDSGGPLLWEKTGRQIGINSFVHIDGCEAGQPSGYARVPCFIDWIKAAQAL